MQKVQKQCFSPVTWLFVYSLLNDGFHTVANSFKQCDSSVSIISKKWRNLFQALILKVSKEEEGIWIICSIRENHIYKYTWLRTTPLLEYWWYLELGIWPSVAYWVFERTKIPIRNGIGNATLSIQYKSMWIGLYFVQVSCAVLGFSSENSGTYAVLLYRILYLYFFIRTPPFPSLRRHSYERTFKG